MTDVTLVTCASYPQLDPDDLLLSTAIQNFGLSVNAAVWSDPSFAWQSSRLCVIRSTWDYDQHRQAFSNWLHRIKGTTRLCNDASLVEWNIDKSYLQSLSQSGVKVIPTVWLNADEQIFIDDLIKQFGPEIVIKPVVGLGGIGVARHRLDEHCGPGAVSNIQQLQKYGKVIIQPFINSVFDEGERSLVFFEGSFSHAVRKSPFATLAYAGCAGEQVLAASAEEIKFGLEVLGKLPIIPLYARVDVVFIAGEICLMELELIEPSLYFSYAPEAAPKLAALIAMRLR